MTAEVFPVDFGQVTVALGQVTADLGPEEVDLALLSHLVAPKLLCVFILSHLLL